MNEALRDDLAGLVRWAHGRGWSPGTGGNYAMSVSMDPFQMLITPSGADKGAVMASDLLVVDANAAILEGTGKPSAETLLHIVLMQELGVTAIAHTHSIWNSLASLQPEPAFLLSGYEMLKGLSGITTHEHTERVPILENSQDIPAMAETLRDVIRANPGMHAFLIRGHGLYSWGYNSFEVRRHLEVLEFLFELELRRRRIG